MYICTYFGGEVLTLSKFFLPEPPELRPPVRVVHWVGALPPSTLENVLRLEQPARHRLEARVQAHLPLAKLVLHGLRPVHALGEVHQGGDALVRGGASVLAHGLARGGVGEH